MDMNLNLDEVVANVDMDDVIDAATSLATTEVMRGRGIPKEAKYAIAVAGGIAVGVVAAEVVIPAVRERLPEPKPKKRRKGDGEVIDVEATEITEEEDPEEKKSNNKKKSNKKK